MNSRYLTRIVMVMSILALMLVQPLFSEQPPLPYKKAQKAALSYAEQLWGKVQVGEGIVFVDPADYPTIYMFTIYCGKDVFPDEDAILNQVADARAYRLQGEALLKQGEEIRDHALIEKGYQMVEEGWKRMLDEDNFGTMFVSALHLEHPGVEMYRGLPLNYVALDDAKQIAESELAAKSSVLRRYIFWGLFDYGAEFEANGKTVLINLKTRELIDTDTQLYNMQSGWFNKEQLNREFDAPENPALDKLSSPPDPAPPFEVKLSGVPDYQTIYSRGCAPAASGCVLGYHDAAYNLLIDGGNKNYAGHRDPNGEGYLHTIWDELADAMDYVVGFGTYISQIDDGIRAVCNYAIWENNYNFTVSYGSWGSPSSQYSSVKSQIYNNRPLVYTLRYPTYGGGGGYHSVTLIGYGCLQPPWVPNLTNSNGQNQTQYLQKPTDTYEYLYICHDNNSGTGKTIYLWWSEFMSSGHMITVRPGGGSLLMSMNTNTNLSCWNFPNPFNPATEIRYTISMKSPISIKILNIMGQMVYNFNEGVKEPGSYSVHWNGCDASCRLLAGGNYFYQIKAGNEIKIGKMTLLR